MRSGAFGVVFLYLISVFFFFFKLIYFHFSGGIVLPIFFLTFWSCFVLGRGEVFGLMGLGLFCGEILLLFVDLCLMLLMFILRFWGVCLWFGRVFLWMFFWVLGDFFVWWSGCPGGSHSVP